MPAVSGDPTGQPRRNTVIVTCMDARIDPLGVLGMELGDAQVLRTGGGRVVPAVVDSVAVACGVFEVERIVVAHHTNCGMANPEDVILDAIERSSGHRPSPLAIPPIVDADEALAHDVGLLDGAPQISDQVTVTGIVVDSATGEVVSSIGDPLRL